MKRTITRLLALLVLLIGVSGNANALTWTQMSQIQKTMAVMNAASAAVGTTGGECIYWIQMLLNRVSSGAPNIMPYRGSPVYTWQANSNFVKKVDQSYKNLQYGDFVEMRFHNTLPPYAVSSHTAMVVGGACGADGSMGFAWVDSNINGDGKVTSHYWSNQYFYDRVVKYGELTIYRLK